MFVVSQERGSFARRHTAGRYDRVLLRPRGRPAPPGSQRFVPRLRVILAKSGPDDTATRLPPPPPAELVRPPSAATATTTARRTRGGTPVSLEAATPPGCGETLFPRGSGCFNLPRCGLARVRDFFPPSPPLHPNTFMLGRSVCDLCPLLYRTGNVPPPAFFGFPLFLLS